MKNNFSFEKKYCKIAGINECRKVTSTSPSHLEACAGFFRLSLKGKFDASLL